MIEKFVIDTISEFIHVIYMYMYLLAVITNKGSYFQNFMVS